MCCQWLVHLWGSLWCSHEAPITKCYMRRSKQNKLHTTKQNNKAQYTLIPLERIYLNIKRKKKKQWPITGSHFVISDELTPRSLSAIIMNYPVGDVHLSWTSSTLSLNKDTKNRLNKLTNLDHEILNEHINASKELPYLNQEMRDLKVRKSRVTASIARELVVFFIDPIGLLGMKDLKQQIDS